MATESFEEKWQRIQMELEHEFTLQISAAAIAQIDLATALLAKGYWNERSCLILSGITPHSRYDMDYLVQQLQKIIPAPGAAAYTEIHTQVQARVGRRIIQKKGDGWYELITEADLKRARDILAQSL